MEKRICGLPVLDNDDFPPMPKVKPPRVDSEESLQQPSPLEAVEDFTTPYAIVYSCQCRKKTVLIKDIPDYPWVTHPAHCLRCGLHIAKERIA